MQHQDNNILSLAFAISPLTGSRGACCHTEANMPFSRWPSRPPRLPPRFVGVSDTIDTVLYIPHNHITLTSSWSRAGWSLEIYLAAPTNLDRGHVRVCRRATVLSRPSPLLLVFIPLDRWVLESCGNDYQNYFPGTVAPRSIGGGVGSDSEGSIRCFLLLGCG